MTSKLVVNTIEADTGISSVSFASSISMNSTAKFHFSAAGVDIGADTNINRPAAGVLGFNISGAEKLRIDTNGHLNTSGIATASNFKTGSSNLHSTGLTVGNNFLHTTGINVGTGATIHVPTSNVLTLGTNSSERLRINSSGEVSIGTASGGKTLTLYGASSSSFRISKSGILAYDHTFDGSTYTIANNNGSAGIPIVIGTKTGGGESLRIDSSGSVGINESTPDSKVDILYSSSTDTATQNLIHLRTDPSGSYATRGLFVKIGRDGNYDNSAAHYDIVGSSGNSGTHIFEVQGSEKLRIKTDGRVVLNNAAVGSNEYLTLGPNGSTPCDMAFRLNNDNDARIKFYDGGSTLRGLFGYTTYANNSAYPNFHDSFYLQTDPSSNGTLATALRISNSGQFLKPLTYQFFVETNGQSVSGGWTKLTGLTPDSTHCTGVSNGTYWSNSNSRFTAPVTGTYNFFIGGFSSTAEGGGTNHRYMYLFRINGGNYYYGFGGNYSDQNTPMAGGSIYYKLNVNDYVEVYYYSAISATWGENSHRFFWGGYLVG